MRLVVFWSTHQPGILAETRERRGMKGGCVWLLATYMIIWEYQHNFTGNIMDNIS